MNQNRLLWVLVLLCLILTTANLLRSTRADLAAAAAGCETRPRLYSADANGDGGLDIADAIALLDHLFAGGPTPVCLAEDGAIGSLTPEQAEILSHLSIVELPIDDAGATARAIRISGVNVQIVNGLGSTASTNALGNLYLGYDELRQGDENRRDGSHSLIIGSEHNFSGHANVVAGTRNTASGNGASITGGFSNVASGENAMVAGGWQNEASGDRSSICGGRLGAASGDATTIVGGGGTLPANGNRAIAERSVVVGGANNTARGIASVIVGGESNETGAEGEDPAAARWSTIAGGCGGSATGVCATE